MERDLMFLYVRRTHYKIVIPDGVKVNFDRDIKNSTFPFQYMYIIRTLYIGLVQFKEFM